MAKPARFKVLKTSPRYLLILDLGPWEKHLTVTNDAEGVVSRLAKKLAGRRLFYFDSEHNLSEIKIRNGKFAGFASVVTIEQFKQWEESRSKTAREFYAKYRVMLKG